MGKGTFKLLFDVKLDGKIVRAEIDGKTNAKLGAVTFEGSIGGANFNASYKDGKITEQLGKVVTFPSSEL